MCGDVSAEVAGRDHDGDACTDCALDCLHQRVARRRFVDRMTERQIDDINVQLAPVCDGEVDCGNYVARVAVPIPVEHLQSYVLALRCETGILTLRHVTAAP